MKVKKAMRDSLRHHAAQSGEARIGSKTLVDLLDDIEEIRVSLLGIAADVRRPRPADWTPEEADEHIAQVLERLAAEIAE
jgi:hypothetical protein